MMRGIVILGLGITLCAGTLGGQATIQVLRLDYVVVNDGPGPKGQSRRNVVTKTVWIAPDGRQRSETRDAEIPSNRATISDSARDTQIELDYDRKVAVRMARFQERAKTGQSVGDHTFGPVAQKEELGAKQIQGFACQGWRNRHSGLMTEHWFCRDPVSGKKFLGGTFWSFPDGRSTTRTDLQHVQRDVAVDPAMFEIPGDFRIVDK